MFRYNPKAPGRKGETESVSAYAALTAFDSFADLRNTGEIATPATLMPVYS